VEAELLVVELLVPEVPAGVAMEALLLLLAPLTPEAVVVEVLIPLELVIEAEQTAAPVS
jgi:hypothetical protein